MNEERDELQAAPRELPGNKLRAQREARGLSLPHAANELHVDQRVLLALENDDYDALGAPIFVKGHLRNYARLLGLEPASLIAEYEAAQQPSDPELVHDRRFVGEQMQSRQSHAFWRGLGWVLLIIGVIALAGWWYYQQEGGAELASMERDDRVEIASFDDTTETDFAAPAEQQQQAAGASEAEDTPAEQMEPNDEIRTESAEQPDQPALEAGPEVVETPPQDALPAERNEPQRQQPAVMAPALVFEFTDESWVEVYDQEGRPILYDLVRAGTRREIDVTGRLRVFLGNADAVTIHVRGERFAHERYRRADSTARFNVTVPAR